MKYINPIKIAQVLKIQYLAINFQQEFSNPDNWPWCQGFLPLLQEVLYNLPPHQAALLQEVHNAKVNNELFEYPYYKEDEKYTHKKR